MPTKGLSLPLVSAGGSGLVITCAALGLLYSVLRFEHAPTELREQEPLEEPPEIKPVNRPRAVSTSALSASAIWDLSIHH